VLTNLKTPLDSEAKDCLFHPILDIPVAIPTSPFSDASAEFHRTDQSSGVSGVVNLSRKRCRPSMKDRKDCSRT